MLPFFFFFRSIELQAECRGQSAVVFWLCGGARAKCLSLLVLARAVGEWVWGGGRGAVR